jgi:hypothetical protein
VLVIFMGNLCKLFFGCAILCHVFSTSITKHLWCKRSLHNVFQTRINQKSHHLNMFLFFLIVWLCLSISI